VTERFESFHSRDFLLTSPHFLHFLGNHLGESSLAPTGVQLICHMLYLVEEGSHLSVE